MTTDTVIATRGLTKRFGDVLAVDGLELDVRRGEIYGFLGRNGAGKTTTIRMLLGLIRPTVGEVRVLGERVDARALDVFKRVGFLVESASAYPNLTVRENLHIQRRLIGAARDSVDTAIELLALEQYADRRAGRLSLGNKQRLSLARALLHGPEVLVLDEPANGLDPAGIVEVRGLLRSLADDEGVTVFMSSHILAEVAHLADRIGIVHDGRLIEELDRGELQAKARPFLTVGTTDDRRAEELLRAAGFARVESGGTGVLQVLEAAGRAGEVARLLVQAGLELEQLTPSQEDLETYFLRLTGGAPLPSGLGSPPGAGGPATVAAPFGGDE